MRRALTDWRDELPIVQQAQLDEKTLFLEGQANYDEIPPRIVVGPIRYKGTSYPGIYKLQIGGKVAMRPLLCRGPQRKQIELTFLIGATERDTWFSPKTAPETAKRHLDDITSDNRRRRRYATPPKAKAN